MTGIHDQFAEVSAPLVENAQGNLGQDQQFPMLPQRQVYQQQQARPNADLIAYQASLQRG